MHLLIKNLVFEGSGILGIGYLGALDYLDEIDLLPDIEKIAGTSAGAIMACLACFNTPFNDIKKMAATLNYNNMTKQEPLALRNINNNFKLDFEKMFGNINAIYRLLNNYGWYSTKYFYDWIKKNIASQFDSSKKKPPYTLDDFENDEIHINKRNFKKLYITGTDMSSKAPVIFSYDTTPNMEVAEAIRISMSFPLFFEAVKIKKEYRNVKVDSIYADGGVIHNFPINIFDYNGINYETLGICFKNKTRYNEIKNIIDYIENLISLLLKKQENDAINYLDQKRIIMINAGGISSLDFNISDKDAKFLYDQGYHATEDYFEKRII